jgi:hypothetical protein
MATAQRATALMGRVLRRGNSPAWDTVQTPTGRREERQGRLIQPPVCKMTVRWLQNCFIEVTHHAVDLTVL